MRGEGGKGKGKGASMLVVAGQAASSVVRLPDPLAEPPSAATLATSR